MKCKKLATIVSGRKNVALPFIRRKQVNTSAEIHCCYISALVLTCLHLMKGHDRFFRPKTIVEFLAFHGVTFQNVIKSQK